MAEPGAAGSQASGLLLIDKPGSWTSHDVVAKLRGVLGTRKVGHAGTLDPLATGLLLIGVGRATRLLRFLSDLPKSYEGEAVLGVETTTLDADGDVIRRSPVAIGAETLRRTMAAFTGDLDQAPPAYSAVKVGGVKMYEAARRGEAVRAEPRPVRVDEFALRRFDTPVFAFTVRCSSGTYVRSLVADVGAALGCGAHLSALRRTAIGPFDVRGAGSPDDPGPMLPLERAVGHLPEVRLHPEEARVAVHGVCLGPAGIVGPYRAVGPDGRLVGIYHDEGAKAVPDVILAPP